MEVRFHLFGRFQVMCGGQPLRDLEGQKSAELLVYLLVNRDRPLRREQVASELWGNTSTRKSLKHLRQALWQLHTAAPQPWSLIRVDGDWVQLDARDVWIDAEAFERAFVETRDHSGFDLDATSAARLRDAAALYAADLLTGWNAEWCLLERERLRASYLLMLDKLMDHASQQRQPEVGLGYGTTSLGLDGAREATFQRLMQLHYQAGDRTAALRQYERCVAALSDELGVRPGRRTEALQEAIEADRGFAALALEAAHPEPAARFSEDLQQIRDTLSTLQRQLSAAIEDTRADG